MSPWQRISIYVEALNVEYSCHRDRAKFSDILWLFILIWFTADMHSLSLWKKRQKTIFIQNNWGIIICINLWLLFRSESRKKKVPPKKEKDQEPMNVNIWVFVSSCKKTFHNQPFFKIWFWIGISDINGANSAWLNLNRKPKVQSTLRVTLLVPGMHNQKTKTLKKKLCMNYDTLRFLPYDHMVFLVLNLLARQKN